MPTRTQIPLCLTPISRILLVPVCSTDSVCGNTAGPRLVSRPLALLRVVADKRDRHIVLVEDRNPALQLRDDGVVPMKTNLARTPQMLRDVANERAVKVKVAEAKVFPIADKQQRLIVALVHG